MSHLNLESCSLNTGIILEGFCAHQIPIDVIKPRSLRLLGPSDLLILERGTESVVHLFDSDGDGFPDSRQRVASAPSLNHGLAIHDGYLYASSDSTVYRWELDGNNLDFNSLPLPLENQQALVHNINQDGSGGAPLGHQTRTLEFDGSGRLYISVGSDGNVDPDSHRSRIRRVQITGDEDFSTPLDFQTLEVFTDGLRNTVGLAFDKHGVLWGVENSADNLQRDDLGGDITENNPAEELNRFPEDSAGSHFGYPYCWTEFSLPVPPGNGTGSVWAWPSFLGDSRYTDERCRNEYEAPIVSMQAHSAPLGIVFYRWNPETLVTCFDVEPFPEWMDGYAFVAYHGSWNRDVPTGYKIVYIPMDNEGNATGPPVDLLSHQPPNAKWEDGFRPVDVDFDVCGRLWVTSDGTDSIGSKIVRVDWTGPKCEETSVDPSVETSLESSEPSCQPVDSRAPTELASSDDRSEGPTATFAVSLCLLILGIYLQVD